MINKTAKLESILKLVENLPNNRAEGIIDELFSKLAVEVSAVDNSVYTLNTEAVTFCRKCGSIHIVKNGKDRRGHTRFLCRDCGATFGELSGTTVFGSHKGASVWKKYISLMLEGCSLVKCAEECKISVPTAFVWRHKILNALTDKSFSPSYNGLIEMDEMYVRISYKGNHKNSKDFTMPRKSFKRGSDNRIPGNNAKASVLCIVERDKGFSGIIPCRGILNLPLLNEIFDERISDESIVLTDGLRAYNQYFQNKNTEHIILPSQRGKPTIKGPFHINNVNALQRRFRRFLIDYNGVSTKYLNNYLALFIWLENHKHYKKQDLMLEEITRVGSYISAANLAAMAPIPDLAPAVA